MGSVLLDVDYGILIGFGAVAFAIIARSILSHSHILGTIQQKSKSMHRNGDGFESTIFVERTIYSLVFIHTYFQIL